MRRGSLIGPVLLILVGGLFLANNMKLDLPVMKLVGDYWPFVLIGWGVLRLMEIVYWASTRRPLPMQGISGGEWVFIVFLCILGSAFSVGNRVTRSWPPVRVTMGGLDFLGESFDFALAEQTMATGKTPRVVIENLRGNVRVVGGDVDQVKAGGRTTVRAFRQEEADKINKDCRLEIVRQGDLYIVRTNHEKATGNVRISTELEVTVPRGASVEGRGRSGDFDVSELGGNVDVSGENGAVRISNLGGSARLDLRRSDLIRAVNVKGGVDIKGSGADLDLDNIEGQATVMGSYSGELNFRRLAKPLHYQSSTTDLRVAKVPGQIRMGRGDLTANNIVGPVLLKTGSKDVDLSDFTESVEVTVERGDIEVRPGRAVMAPLDVRTRAGNISAALPANGHFQMAASAERGSINNDYGPTLIVQTDNHGAKMTGPGASGSGPQVTLVTTRGEVSVRKAAAGGATESVKLPTREPIKLEVDKQ